MNFTIRQIEKPLRSIVIGNYTNTVEKIKVLRLILVAIWYYNWYNSKIKARKVED